MEKKKIEDMSFEEAFAKLNKILEEFENGEVSLETSISLYEEGMLLKNHCDKKLQNAEMKIKKVVGVVETGLFINMANSVIIGNNDGSFKLIERKG